MASLSGLFNFQQFTDSGEPLASGRVYTYTAGTTTKKTAYTDAGASVAHTYVSDGSGGEYIALNSRGELPYPLYLASGAYDIALKRSDGTTVWTRRASGLHPSQIYLSDFGAAGDGVTDDLSKFQELDGPASHIDSPAVNYKLSSTWQPAARDVWLTADADVSFSTSKPDLRYLIPYESVPGVVWSHDVLRKTYGSEFAGFGNCFQRASIARSNVTTVPVVAIFSLGETLTSGSRAWGLNTSAFANAAGSTAISYELNAGVLGGGGTAYALVIASSGGGGQVENAIQIDSNETASRFKDGFVAHFVDTSSRGCISGSIIKITGGGGAASTCERFLYATQVTASTAEIDFPSLLVDPTPASVANRLRIKGGAAGVGPLLLPDGETNTDLNFSPKGTGSIGLYDNTLTKRFSVNATGIGFFTTSPVAKQTVTGSKGGNVALANLMTALAAYGLVTDSTS